MIWAPSGAAVAAGTVATPTNFDTKTNGAGGVAWVFNDTATSETFTLGASTMNSNAQAIPLGPNAGMYVAYGPDQRYCIASVATVFVTPGVALK